MNGDRNLFGRALALVLLLAAAYGVRAILRGGSACAAGDSRCTMGAPAAPAGGEEAAPAEKPGTKAAPDEDEESKLERKAPVVPPAK